MNLLFSPLMLICCMTWAMQEPAPSGNDIDSHQNAELPPGSAGGLTLQANNGSYTEDLPDWVKTGPRTVEGTTFLVAQTERPFSTPLEADKAIEEAVRSTVERHCGEILAGQTLWDIGIDDAYLRANLMIPDARIVRRHHEKLDGDAAVRFGEDEIVFYRGYAQIRLTPEFSETLRQKVLERRTWQRLVLAACGAAACLGILGVAFTYLRVDHATRGFYSGRLQMLGFAIVVLVLAITYFLANWLM